MGAIFEEKKWRPIFSSKFSEEVFSMEIGISGAHDS